MSDALVLGGGVAGLTAAHELAERGFRVVVLERRPSVGGKARSLYAAPTSLGPGPERYRESFRRAVLPAFLLVLPGVAFMIASADTLVETLLGGQWSEAAPIFIALSIAGLLQTSNSPAT